MILQFAERNNTRLGISKIMYSFCENKSSLSPSLLEEIVRNESVDSELIKEVANKLNTNNKEIKTPFDDESKIPFIIDKNEYPVTVVNDWLRYIARRGSPKTWKTYAYAIFDFLQFLEANNLVWQNINDEILIKYRDTQALFSSFRKQPLKKKTIQFRLLVVSWFYVYAVEREYLEKNPITLETVTYHPPMNASLLSHTYTTKERKQPAIAYRNTEAKPQIKSRSSEVVWSWINSITNKRDRLIAKIMYQTGVRREEIVIWKIDQIPKNKVNQLGISNRVSFEIKGKGGKVRPVDLSESTYAELMRWINIYRAKILKKAGVDHDFVWVSFRGGKPLLVSALNSFFKEVSDKHGTKITPHMLRHSFAMEKRRQLYEMRRENPEKRLQQMLGHSSIVTTMTTYGHTSPQDLSNEAADNLELILNLTE